MLQVSRADVVSPDREVWLTFCGGDYRQRESKSILLSLADIVSVDREVCKREREKRVCVSACTCSDRARKRCCSVPRLPVFRVA